MAKAAGKKSTAAVKKARSNKTALWEDFMEQNQRIVALGQTQALLDWDQMTWMPGHTKQMPEKAAEARGRQLATMATLSHEMVTDKALQKTLTALQETATFKSLSKQEKALVKRVQQDVDDAKKIPPDLVKAMAETTSRASHVWEKAYAKRDFKLFAPVLQEVIDLNIRKAKAKGYKGSPYNALLDDYEPGLTVADLDKLFGGLKKDLVLLVQAIQKQKAPDTDFLKQTYNFNKQWDFSIDILKAMGFDFDRGCLALSTHPFTTTIGGINDVRITTRQLKKDLFDPFSIALHEGGHAIYEQGISAELDGTLAGDGTSLGIHESQSRIYELMIGQSKPFWQHFYPKLKKLFPKQLNNVSLDKFYKAINQVKPSYIRTQADEVTYILHVILRYEIEKALIEQTLNVKDIPKVWNQKMRDTLGLMPPHDGLGCLQDVHWSMGAFGYFPTYALGTLAAAQFFRQAQKDVPQLNAKIAKGNLKPFKTWLNKNIHACGRLELPKEIMQRVTGEPLNTQYFLAYLNEKYGALYGLAKKSKSAR